MSGSDVLVAVGAALAVLLGAVVSWVTHTRAVITAEQRGRITEIERQRSVARAVREAQDVAIGRVLDAGDRSAAAAERSVREDAVTPRERDRWIGDLPRDPE